jgi:hypothetical protein
MRITGNFRLLNRLLTRVERILEINALPTMKKKEVVAPGTRESCHRAVLKTLPFAVYSLRNAIIGSALP